MRRSVIVDHLDEILDFCRMSFDRWGQYPSVRDIFYAFVGVLWANTRSEYNMLSSHIKDLKLDGTIPYYMVRDGSGREVLLVRDYEVDPDDYIDVQIRIFKDSWKYYSLPKWLDQEYRVVVACEKEGDYPVIKHIADDEGCSSFFMRGYTGINPIFELKEHYGDQKLIIIYIGDFDPSGEDIPRALLEDMLRVGLNIVKLEKVIVTKEQIEKYKLPHRPEDATEIAKLKRDPRFKGWVYGLYRVETSALKSRHPDVFEDVIRSSIRKYFDEEVYERVKEREDRLREEVRDRIEKLTEKLVE